jgi:hypothetical protein
MCTMGWFERRPHHILPSRPTDSSTLTLTRQSSHILRPGNIYNLTQQSPTLRLCSASWRWASNTRNMSRLWTSIKWESEVCIKLTVLITRLYSFRERFTTLTSKYRYCAHVTFKGTSDVWPLNVPQLTPTTVKAIFIRKNYSQFSFYFVRIQPTVSVVKLKNDWIILWVFISTPKWNEFLNNHIFSNLTLSGFGGLGVACWPLVPKFAGSNTAEAVGFFRAKKSSARLPSEGK